MSTNNGKIDPKFQEALNHLYNRASNRDYWCKQGADEEARDILQELIEEHQKNLTYISTLEKILKETDKALDSACQIIAKCKCFKGCPFEEDCNEVDCFNENMWKEYFMEGNDE